MGKREDAIAACRQGAAELRLLLEDLARGLGAEDVEFRAGGRLELLIGRVGHALGAFDLAEEVLAAGGGGSGVVSPSPATGGAS